MKIYLLKIYNYDSLSSESFYLTYLKSVDTIPCMNEEFAKREMIKHNFDMAFEKGWVPEDHNGYDGWEMIDFDNTSYVIEEVDMIEE